MRKTEMKTRISLGGATGPRAGIGRHWLGVTGSGTREGPFSTSTKLEKSAEEISGPDWTARDLKPSQNCAAGSSPGLVQLLPWLTFMPL